MEDFVKYIENTVVERKELPEFKAGDTINVSYKIVEGSKERLQSFQGVVLQRKGESTRATFTVRKISNGVGVERVFPVSSPFIESISVLKRGKVRRARLFYLRHVSGKAARIKEKIIASA